MKMDIWSWKRCRVAGFRIGIVTALMSFGLSWFCFLFPWKGAGITSFLDFSFFMVLPITAVVVVFVFTFGRQSEERKENIMAFNKKILLISGIVLLFPTIATFLRDGLFPSVAWGLFSTLYVYSLLLWLEMIYLFCTSEMANAFFQKSYKKMLPMAFLFSKLIKSFGPFLVGDDVE